MYRAPLRVRLSNKEKQAYPAMFAQADPKNSGKVEGRTAVEFFRNSGLPVDTLKEVWNISTPGGEGFLDRERFFVALRLIALAQHGKPANAQSIAANIEVDLPRFGPVEAEGFDLTPEDRLKYETIFTKSFPGKTVVTGQEARQLFDRTGVVHTELVKIWNLSDPQDTGVLTKNQFIVAMQLILKARQRVQIPEVLPACLQAVLSANVSALAAHPTSPVVPTPQPQEKPVVQTQANSVPPPVAEVDLEVPVKRSERVEQVSRPAIDPAVLEALTSSSQELLRTVKSLEKRMDDLSSEVKSTKTELKSLRESSLQRQSDSFALIEDIAKGQKRLANEEKDFRESLLRSIHDEISGLQFQTPGQAASGEELAEIRGELSSLKLVKGDISSLRQDLMVLAEVRDQFGEVQGEIQGLRDDFRAIADVKTQLTSVEGQLNDLESRQTEAKALGDDAIKKIELLGEELEDMVKSLTEEISRNRDNERREETRNEEIPKQDRQELRFEPETGREEAKPAMFARVNDPFALPKQAENPILNSDPFDFEALSQPAKPAIDPHSSARSPRALPGSFAFESPPKDAIGLDFDLSDNNPEASGSPHQQDFDFILGKVQRAPASPPKEANYPLYSPAEAAGKESDPFQLSPGEGDKRHFDFALPQSGDKKDFEFDDKEEFEERKGGFEFDAEKKNLDFDF